jgi:hypothetical protein
VYRYSCTRSTAVQLYGPVNHDLYSIPTRTRAPASRRSFGRSSSRWLIHGCTADAASGDMPETSEAVLAYTRTVGSTAPCKSTNELRIIHTMCFVRASYIGLHDVLVQSAGGVPARASPSLSGCPPHHEIRPRRLPSSQRLCRHHWYKSPPLSLAGAQACSQAPLLQV